MSDHRVAFAIKLPAAQEAAVRGLGDKPIEKSLEALACLALTEWLEWLVADDRPASLTEVSKRRVRSIVDGGLLPKIPTAPVIAQRARLTLGQARYIVTALALENPAGTTEARNGLVLRLEAALHGASIPDPRNLDAAGIAALVGPPVVIDVPRQWADLASATHEELLNEAFSDSNELDIRKLEPPIRRRRTDSYVEFSMMPRVAVAIFQRLCAAGMP